MRKSVKRIALFLAVVTVVCTAAMAAYAQTDFEKSIAGFPESYAVKLKALHEKYPNWKFKLLKTCLDWNEVLDAESSGDRSLIEEYCTSYAFKSSLPGDYDEKKESYIFKDGGFVTASKNAVAYYLDPRNFLSASGIFQFENLNFTSSCTLETVESILYNTFMYNTKITYYTSAGVKKTASIKYSQQIYNAGKKYDINPCFLAAKIVSEIGSVGSSSVSGTYSGYEGIYNFYNIGATDGAGAIARGLSWAKSNSTYGRPWTTPMKSITGGAEFLAEQYIACGQNTGYLQKFQVNPKADYSLYNHQYMTNVMGAHSQGYKSYQSYLGCGILASAHEFVIPVYENMPGEKKPSAVLNLADSIGQVGTAISAAVLRTGPSASYATVGVTVPVGAKVTLLGKVMTDASHYLSVCNAPYWYKLSYTAGSKTYTGYTYCGNIDETSRTLIPIGSYKLLYSAGVSGSDDQLGYIVDNTSVASASSDTLTAKKTGTVTVKAYSPCGGFDTVLYKVVSASAAAERTVSSLAVSQQGCDRLTVTWKGCKSASGYNVCLFDSGNKLVKSVNTTAQKVTFSSLKTGKTYVARVRSYESSSSAHYFGPFASVKGKTAPAKVTGGKGVQVDDGLMLTWTAVSGADGYEVALYTGGKYTTVMAVKTNKAQLDHIEVTQTSNYRVRAYSETTAKVYGEYSDAFSTDYTYLSVKGIKQKSATTDSITLTWDKNDRAEGYRLYTDTDGDGVYKTLEDVTKNSYTLKGLQPGTKKNIRISGIGTTNKGTKVYSEASAVFTAASMCRDMETVSNSFVSTSGYKLTWKPVEGCDGYILGIRQPDGSYEKYTQTADTEYTFKKFSGRKVCAVCAYVKYSGGELLSEYSNAVDMVFTVGAVEDLRAVSLNNGMSLTWQTPEIADGCIVEYFEPDLGMYIPMLTTGESEYTVFGIENGAFRVRAYCEASDGTKYSFYSQISAKAN